MHNVFLNKSVLITGHSGFKGIWLSLLLSKFGAKVHGYSLCPVNNPIYDDLESSTFEKIWYEDIRDDAKLKNAIHSAEPDIIFHLAAQPLVIESYAQPVHTFDVNVNGTIHLLNTLRDYSKDCIVIVVTTDKVYENHEWVYPYRETDDLGGHDPYSTSKACVELVVQSFRRSYFSKPTNKRHVAIASVRAGNVIGGGDWSFNRIIPDIVRSLHSGLVLEIRNPKAIRPWQHVLDALYGYLILTKKMLLDITNPVWTSAWNFGPASNGILNVCEITDIAAHEWGVPDHEIRLLQALGAHEAGLLGLDCSKAMHHLHWKPVWNAQVAISRTIEWYKKVLLYNERPGAVALEQIHLFLSEVGA